MYIWLHNELFEITESLRHLIRSFQKGVDSECLDSGWLDSRCLDSEPILPFIDVFQFWLKKPFFFLIRLTGFSVLGTHFWLLFPSCRHQVSYLLWQNLRKILVWIKQISFFNVFFRLENFKLQENQGVCFAGLVATLGLLREFIIRKLLIKRKHGHLIIDQLAKHQGTRLWKYIHFEFIQKVDQFLPIAPRNKLFWYTRKMKGEMK